MLGTVVERVVVASIIPLNFSWNKFDWKNQKDLDYMQLDPLVTDYLLSIVCTEIKETIIEDEEMRENAYLIWKFLKNLYDKDYPVWSVESIVYQDTSVNNWEIKVS